MSNPPSRRKQSGDAGRGESESPAAASPTQRAPGPDADRTLTFTGDQPTPAAPAERAPGTLIGRYVLEGELGRGGLGVVFRAYDPDLERPVALKVLFERGAPERERSLIVREARAAAGISHPNVVSIFDIGEHRGQLFIAMELVRGETVRDWLKSAPRSRAEILEVFAQAADGLAAAHARDLVHRDVKLSNLLVGDDGRVRVADFGLAHPAPASSRETSDRDRSLDQADTVAGTPGYMAPEQRGNANVDARADQFSLCVSLVAALTGQRPDIPAAPTATWPPVVDGPRWQRRLLRRGLAWQPEDRFPSMAELARGLRRGQRRRRVALAAVVAAVAVALGFAWWIGSESVATRCDREARAIDATWSPERRAALAREVPGDSGNALIAALDRAAVAWAGERRALCMAAARDELAPATHAARGACLAGARAGLDELIELAPRAALQGLRLANALGRGPMCDHRVITGTAASHEEQLARLDVQSALTPARPDLPGALAALETAAVERGDWAIAGWARFAAARRHAGLGDAEAQSRGIDAAIWAAERADIPELRARLWLDRARLALPAHPDQAVDAVAHAEAIATRLWPGDPVHGHIAVVRAAAARAAGKPADEQGALQAALAWARRWDDAGVRAAANELVSDRK